MFGLAALVVLARCVVSNVDESISRAAEGLVVEHSCDYRIDSTFSVITDRQFLLRPSGVFQVQVFVSKNKDVVFIPHSRFSAQAGCAYKISIAKNPQNASGFRPIEIGNSSGGFLASEMEEYQNQIALCERLASFAARKKYFGVVGPYLEGFGVIESDAFPGGTVVVDNYSIAFELRSGGMRFRIATIMDELLTTKIES